MKPQTHPTPPPFVVCEYTEDARESTNADLRVFEEHAEWRMFARRCWPCDVPPMILNQFPFGHGPGKSDLFILVTHPQAGTLLKLVVRAPYRGTRMHYEWIDWWSAEVIGMVAERYDVGPVEKVASALCNPVVD